MGTTGRIHLLILLSLLYSTTAQYQQGPSYGPAVGPAQPISYNLQPPSFAPQSYAPQIIQHNLQSFGQAQPTYGQGPQIIQAYGQQSQGQSFGQAAVNSGANIVNAQSNFGQSSAVDQSLAGGIPGGPGIRFRVNKPAFRYASQAIAPILSNQIRNARIPDISQCLPQVDGCLRVSGIFISNYQCPERIQIRPSPPNQVLIVVKNANFQVTGNLGGKVTVLAPLALTGQFYASAQGISISVGLAVQRSPQGGLSVQITSCHATVGFIGLQIVNGGVLGNLASNPTFSRKISRALKKILPSKVCAQLPQIVNQQVNSRLGSLQTSIPLTKILEVAGGALGPLLGQNAGAANVCPAECKTTDSSVSGTSTTGDAITTDTTSDTTSTDTASTDTDSTSSSDASVSSSVGSQLSATAPPSDPPARKGTYDRRVKVQRKVRAHGKLSHRPTNKRTSALAKSHGIITKQNVTNGIIVRNKRQVDCSACKSGGSGGDTGSLLMAFTKSLDMTKLNDLLLSLNLQNTYATNQDFTADLSGEFSPNGAGGTPFSPYLLNFPPPSFPPRMAEGLISDYTLNSLLYWLHQKGFITINIGPDTPKIGGILKTTCSEDEDEDLEDHGVELDDGDNDKDIATKRRKHRKHVSRARRDLQQVFTASNTALRVKRQDEDGGSLEDLGICLGDVLPAVREAHPKQKVEITIKSVKAPFVILSQGKAHVELNMDAELYIQETHEKVGTINADIAADINVTSSAGKLSGSATISRLNLTDSSGSLGLPQDALDNLGGLGKDFVEKAINDALEKGISLNMPAGVGGLPISFQNPDFQLVDHALYVAADINVDQNGLAPLLAQQGIQLQGDQCQSRG